MRLIDADALPVTNAGIVDAAGNFYGADDFVFKGDIDKAQTIDPARRGKWIIEERNDLIYIYCSECKRFGVETPYCPFCGAKMDEVKD